MDFALTVKRTSLLRQFRGFMIHPFLCDILNSIILTNKKGNLVNILTGETDSI